VYLTKLAVDPTSREFRRDYADVREMHRTVMSGFSDLTDNTPARQAHAVLWRLDNVPRGFTQYIQSRSEPDWGQHPAGYLTAPPQTRSLQPLLDAITPGRRFVFRLVANPIRSVARPSPRSRTTSWPAGAETQNGPDGTPTNSIARGRKVAIHEPDDQIRWLIRQAERYGFAIPTGANGLPDAAPSPCPTLTGRRRPGEQGPITVDPVRFEGHLIVTDASAFTAAILEGIGRGKAYGCGLLSLAPAHTTHQQPTCQPRAGTPRTPGTK
jgi:CRISPR system Cascade subunit CasE